MAFVSTSTLSRYRLAIIGVAGIATVYSIYLLYDSRSDRGQTHALQRSNAFRRRQRHEIGTPLVDAQSHLAIDNTDVVDVEPVAFDEAQEPGTADDLTEMSMQDDDAARMEEDQQLRELLFAIAKNEAESQGNVHRGISCDRCGRTPISGNRYKCTNCFDYDLCEDCEALNEHLRTHVFYKIRIPAKWVDRHPQTPWYPGKPHLLPPELPQALKNRLAEKTGFSRNRVDGLYHMFSCLANKNWEADPNPIGMAIDRSAFYRCLVPQISTRAIQKPNLVYDRLFSFFDHNNDGMVGFEEFLEGVVLVQNTGMEARKRRVFKCFDLDDDGFVSRKDFLKMFRAYYIMNKDMVLDQLKANREGENAERVIHHQTPDDLIKSSRPLSQYFPNDLNIDVADWINPRQFEHKTYDRFGDLVPESDGTAAVFSRGQDPVDRRDVYAERFTTAEHDFDADIRRILFREEPQWLALDQIYVTYGPEEGPPSEYIVEHIGMPWAVIKRAWGTTVHVRVMDIDIEAAMGYPTDWKGKLDDEAFTKPVVSRVMDRIMEELRQKKLVRANELLGKHEAYLQFHLEDESNPFVERNSSPAIPSGAPPTNVGGSAAAQTIYDVIQKALNELLDPLFGPVEDVALSVHRTAVERNRYASELRQLWAETRHHEITLYKYMQTLLQLNNDHFWDSRVSWGASARKNTVAYKAWMSAISQIQATNWPSKRARASMAEPKPSEDLSNNARMQEEVNRPRDTAENLVDRDDDRIVTPGVADLDPTMPQNKPNAVLLSRERSFLLLRDELIAWNINQRGGPGRLSYDEFASNVESAVDSDGRRLLGWVEDWLNLAMF